ncbi:MAG TPA: hypothetical protein VGE78_08985, partial [Agromyces sp.]
EDASHYFGAEPAIDIEKATNGDDADEAPGVPLTAGDDVVWTYVVTNTGNAPLVDIAVTDDKVDASEITCGDGESNVFEGPLAPGESFECTASGVAISGAYVNTGTASGHVPGTELVVTDADPANYTGTAVVIPPTESPEPSDPPASTPPASTAGDLPDTGVAPLAGIVGGAIAIIVGFVVIVATRRRKASRRHDRAAPCPLGRGSIRGVHRRALARGARSRRGTRR